MILAALKLLSSPVNNTHFVAKLGERLNNNFLAGLKTAKNTHGKLVNVIQYYTNNIDKNSLILTPQSLTHRVQDNLHIGSNTIIDRVQSHTCFSVKEYPVLTSPALVRSAVSALQKGHPASVSTHVDEIKNKYDRFITTTTNSIINLEKLVAENESDTQVVFNYMKNSDCHRGIKGKSDDNILNTARRVEEKVVSNLHIFKKSIQTGNDVEGRGKTRLKALEITADAFAKRIISKLKRITSEVELNKNSLESIG